MKKVLTWAVVESAFLFVAYFAVIEQASGARNVLLVFLWTAALIMAICLQGGVRQKIDKTPSPVPKWVRRSISIAVLLAFIWFGEWLFALPWALCWLISGLARVFDDQDAKDLAYEVEKGRQMQSRGGLAP